MQAKIIPRLTAQQIERFWSEIEIGKMNDCWIWAGCKNPSGYGYFSIGENQYLAHRVSFLIHHGTLDHSLMVLHSCDNPPCVNPLHLRSGKAVDNSRDAVNRGRAKPFGRSYSQILTAESQTINKGYRPESTKVKLKKSDLFTALEYYESSTVQKPSSITFVNNSSNAMKPQVILLDFDGIVILRREMELPDAAIAYAREESSRVDSAYALVDGKIHFFRYGTEIEFDSESHRLRAA